MIEGSRSEGEIRIQLAAAYRIAALEGLDDGVFNHFSCAVPGEPGHFLLKPFGPLFEEVTASSLIKVDLSGRIVAGEGHWEPTAFAIHARIHARVPRAACVMHTHMPYATALSALADMRLLPISQSAMRFVDRLALVERYAGLVLDEHEANTLADALAEHDLALLANHGIMVIGPTVASCLYDLHYFEVAARDQWLARNAGMALRMIDDTVITTTAAQMVEERRYAAVPYLQGMMRKLDRLNSGYDA